MKPKMNSKESISIILPKDPVKGPKHITFRPSPEDYMMIEELKEFAKAPTTNKLFRELIQQAYKQNILHKGCTHAKV